MTLNKLHKLLGELIPIEGVTAQWVGQDDGDGSIKINKDGTEHGIVTVYFFGGSYERATDRELGAP